MPQESPIVQPIEIAQSLWDTMPPEILQNLTFLINLGKAVSLVFIIYLAFMIVRSILNMKSRKKIKEISNEVDKINKKLDLIIRKLDNKKSKKKKS